VGDDISGAGGGGGGSGMRVSACRQHASNILNRQCQTPASVMNMNNVPITVACLMPHSAVCPPKAGHLVWET